MFCFIFTQNRTQQHSSRLNSALLCSVCYTNIYTRQSRHFVIVFVNFPLCKVMFIFSYTKPLFSPTIPHIPTHSLTHSPAHFTKSQIATPRVKITVSLSRLIHISRGKTTQQFLFSVCIHVLLLSFTAL